MSYEDNIIDLYDWFRERGSFVPHESQAKDSEKVIDCIQEETYYLGKEQNIKSCQACILLT